ncbi:MAG: hypothetical protein PHQ69_08650, partial [Bacteroidales bacterium]|nr:hypothetical protein [Bacteroidales bacterium]
YGACVKMLQHSYQIQYQPIQGKMARRKPASHSMFEKRGDVKIDRYFLTGLIKVQQLSTAFPSVCHVRCLAGFDVP